MGGVSLLRQVTKQYSLTPQYQCTQRELSLQGPFTQMPSKIKQGLLSG